ncbi:DUF2997 domain-containing protein [Calycomorphotria hydatis]|uniref:DUF2997 domain-containing protein n=1 Tax=Calycomorphotria hydatis TaxID=2528027 RepID=A0A517TE50_9PLAN|nr:DUF2997 domain-containing protein [Calycomorphotria hydatis]QDT66649.1 hypothetical protein V22_39200 [Calycomorphotria hydatis]
MNESTLNKTIEIIIAPNGETRIETKGFTGTSCLAASRHFESALGTKTADQKTADYYHTQSESQTESERS